MLKLVLKELFHRDLGKLKQEIGAYKSEQKLWHIEKNIANSGGNLCLHLIGNLNTYIGAELGNTGYVRDRPLEFSAKDIPQQKLLQMIDDTAAVVDATLDKLTDKDLENEYPQLVFEKKTTTGYFLSHLATHLTYHLGQINYHRRLLDGV
ncbi:MAG TPA: DinB family protein [Chitinophaga sp.]